MSDEPLAHASLSDAAAIERLGEAYARLASQLGRVIVGQRAVVEELVGEINARKNVGI